MKRILNDIKLLAASLVLGLGLAWSFTAPVSAQNAAGSAKEAVCQGANLGGGTCKADGNQIEKVIALVIRILSIIAGIAAVIMIIVGGLKYITSGGDSSKVASAKSAIIYAIVGLIVVAVSQFLVRYVLNTATK